VRRRWLIPVLTVMVAAGTAFATGAEAAAPVKTIARYCTPKRDICYGVVLKGGAVYLDVTTERHYFGWYRLCISGGAGFWRCNVYRLRRVGWLATSSVNFAGQFPNVGSGPYRVRWSLGRRPLGPTLHFQLS
jgi:hypothetical protein